MWSPYFLEIEIKSEWIESVQEIIYQYQYTFQQLLQMW
jgi:hypothetical protein